MALHGQSPWYTQTMLDVYRPRRDLRFQNNSLTLVVLRSRTIMYRDDSFVTVAQS